MFCENLLLHSLDLFKVVLGVSKRTIAKEKSETDDL
ncbi:hypothetical protein Lepto7375DRAFT_2595 [Leptolyngbya sp. PCC 7375]|nr:hypothetical protein Lepto7375DRAFT_2595 [Leptolyngbya sp. PCC 7375]